MAWLHVQGTGANNATGTTGVTTFSVTFTNPVTAGNLIVVGVGSFGGGVTTCADNVNSTNYNVGASFGSASLRAILFWFVAPIGGSGFQVTITSASAGFPSMSIDEFSFTAGSTISQDGSGETGNASGANPALSALTPAGTGLDLAIAVVGVQTSSPTYTAGTNYTLTPFQGTYTVSKAEFVATEYSLNRRSAITPAFTGSSSVWAMAAANLLATHFVNGSATLQSTSVINAKASVTYGAISHLACNSVLNGTGSKLGGIANLTCNSILGANGSVQHAGISHLQCTSVINGTGSKSGNTGTSHLVCNSILGATCLVNHAGNAPLLSTSVLGGNGTVTGGSSGTGVTYCDSFGLYTCAAAASLGATSQMIANGAKLTLSGVCYLDSFGLCVSAAAASMGATSQMSASGGIPSGGVTYCDNFSLYFVRAVANLGASSGLSASTSPTIPVTTIEQALVILCGNAGLTIFPYYRPMSTGYEDVITYSFPKRNHTENLLGSAGQATGTFTFRFYSYTYSHCLIMRQELANAIDDFVGTIGTVTIQSIVYKSDRHTTEYSDYSNRWLYILESDYWLKWLEAIPGAQTIPIDGQASLVSTSTVMGNSPINHFASAHLHAICSTLADGVFVIKSSSAKLSCVSTLAGKARRNGQGVATLVGGSRVGCSSKVTHNASSTLVATSVIRGKGAATYRGHCGLLASSALAAFGGAIRHGHGVLLASSALVATGDRLFGPVAVLLGNSSLIGRANVRYSGQCGDAGNSVLSGNCHITRGGQSVLVCGSSLLATGTDTPGSVTTATLYVRSDVSPTVALPTVVESLSSGGASFTYAGGVLTNAKSLSFTAKGGPQDSYTNTFGLLPVSTLGFYVMGQFCSPPLVAQGTIASGDYMIGYGAAAGPINVSAGQAWYFSATLSLFGSDGSFKTLISSFTDFAVSLVARTSTTEVTGLTTSPVMFTGTSYTPSAGDYLCLELVVDYGTTPDSGAQTPTVSIYFGGATAITSDNVATSDAQSFITLPTAITFV